MGVKGKKAQQKEAPLTRRWGRRCAFFGEGARGKGKGRARPD